MPIGWPAISREDFESNFGAVYTGGVDDPPYTYAIVHGSPSSRTGWTVVGFIAGAAFAAYASAVTGVHMHGKRVYRHTRGNISERLY